jgi:hypothetical protein
MIFDTDAPIQCLEERLEGASRDALTCIVLAVMKGHKFRRINVHFTNLLDVHTNPITNHACIYCHASSRSSASSSSSYES